MKSYLEPPSLREREAERKERRQKRGVKNGEVKRADRDACRE